MSYKKPGQLTRSYEWARHLRPRLRRYFWKSERQAERELLQSEADEAVERPAIGTVEDLIQQVESWSTEASSTELWVPGCLTLDGEPIEHGIAMKRVEDRLSGLGYSAAGISVDAGGRLCRFHR